MSLPQRHARRLLRELTGYPLDLSDARAAGQLHGRLPHDRFAARGLSADSA